MNAVTQAEFARRIGVGRSYVTALKKSGRLVMNGDLVLVEESMASIARSNGAPERAAVVTPSFSDSRDKKDHYDAELKRIEYEERCGRLVQAEAVQGIVANAAATLRSRLEALPDQLAPQLAATGDEQQIRAMLADAVESALSELSGQFAEVCRA